MSINASEGFEHTLKRAAATIGSGARRARNQHQMLVVVALVTGTIATALAGIAAAREAPLIASWPVTCWIVAIFTGSAALCTGLIQQLALPKRVADWEACMGRLHALNIAVQLGQRDLTHLLAEYREIIKDYPNCFSDVEV
ncbi:MAG: hypothetical protein FJY56_03910 [Betaproteobacteria bacterium]|nr:hypothetical protein [Betaproteobacteria bacterium]